MIDIQDFFDRLQEKGALFINEEGKISIETTVVIDTLFEFNEKEKNKEQEKRKKEKEFNLNPCKVRKKKEHSRRWTKEEDTFLIEALKKRMTYKEINVDLKERTISAIKQRAWHYKKTLYIRQQEGNKIN